MARSRLTGFSKFLIFLVILAVLFFVGRYVMNNTSLGSDLKEKAEKIKEEVDEKANNSSAETASDNSSDSAPDASAEISKRKKGDDVLRVQLFTWGGYAPGLYFNKGWEANKKSRWYKDYGLKVEFILVDDFPATRQAFAANQVDLIGGTADALPAEMAGLGKYDPQIVMQVDWSRGGDALIAQRGINSINDLKGKKVAVAPMTPSFTFLIKLLETADLDLNDVELVETNDNLISATMFRAREVDAAVVWAPDDEVSVREVPGASILQTTETASNIIADIFIAKKSYINSNRQKIHDFYEGWMKAVAEVNNNKAAFNEAAKYLADGTFYSLDDAKGAMKKAYFTTHGDNMNFFNKNPNYRGVSVDDLYTEMTKKFRKYDKSFPSKIARWQQVTYPGAVSAADSRLKGKEHAPEKATVFKAPTKADENAKAIATKPISINFPVAAYNLTSAAKNIIDQKMGNLIRSFSNARIRVEGNTDDTGSREMNMQLSRKRAQSVVDYLKETYGVTSNRFVVKGNGPDNPVDGCAGVTTESCRAKNRRTEFQLIK